MVRTSIGDFAVYGPPPDSRPTIVAWPGLLFDHRQYDDFARSLATEWRFVTLDPPGFGLTPCPSRKLTIPDCAAAFGEIVEQVGGARPILIGTSWGGIVALRLAEQVRNITAVVALNTPLGPGSRTPVPSLLRFLPAGVFALGACTALFGQSSLGRRKASLRRLVKESVAGSSRGQSPFQMMFRTRASVRSA